MLLGDSHIKIAIRKLLSKRLHARAFAHGRGYGNHTWVFGCDIAEPLTKDLRVGWFRGGLRGNSDLRIKLSRPVVENWIRLRLSVTLPFTCDDMKKVRTFEITEILERRHKGIQIVAINRPYIVKPKLFKKRARHQHALGMAFEPFRELQYRGNRTQDLLAKFPGRPVKPTRQ